ncbi:MAG TPA: hypothetical protein ENK20_07140, partial [Chromatiales bacterium]|nr:hypothetical protein [Chromatiales bacterium]
MRNYRFTRSRGGHPRRPSPDGRRPRHGGRRGTHGRRERAAQPLRPPGGRLRRASRRRRPRGARRPADDL